MKWLSWRYTVYPIFKHAHLDSCNSSRKRNDLKAGLNALCGHCPKDVSMGESCAKCSAWTPETKTADTPSGSDFPKKNIQVW